VNPTVRSLSHLDRFQGPVIDRVTTNNKDSKYSKYAHDVRHLLCLTKTR